MKRAFTEYLRGIGITRTLSRRIGAIHAFCEAACPEDLDDMFLSEYVADDGQRQYEGVWFFSSRFVMEAKHFVTTDDIDIAPFAKRIVHAELRKEEYDFSAATEQSRMNLRCQTQDLLQVELKASGENCTHLKSIYLNHIIPNLAG